MNPPLTLPSAASVSIRIRLICLTFSDDLYNIALLPDGCVIAGGRFTQVNGESRNYLTKLRPDGSLDPAFSVNLNGQIYSVQVQRDGKLFVAGTFNSVNGINLANRYRADPARLHPNGSLSDLGFTPQAFSSGSPSVRLLPNGKILMMSPITDSQGAARGRLIRLNDDGSIDAGLNSDATTTGASSNFANFSIQDDGKIVVIGNFGSVGGISRRGSPDFLPDGADDGILIPPVTISSPSSIAVQLQTEGSFLTRRTREECELHRRFRHRASLARRIYRFQLQCHSGWRDHGLAD